MGRVHVGVLGATAVTLDGKPVHLTPGTTRLLLRLVAAEGEAVTASRLYLDLCPPLRGPVSRGHRNEVQKRVHELRQKLEPPRGPESARLLRTERVLTTREPQSAYRLVLGREQLDHLEFTDLVNRARHAAPATAVALLRRALDLWAGRPLADAADEEFALPFVRRLTRLQKTAREELVRNLTELGYAAQALPVAESLEDDFPDDAEVRDVLCALRERLRAIHADDVLRREFPGLQVEVVIRRGDLFGQDDANLVVGFGDTFDTDTDNDAIISRESTQGQLLERVYGGDRKRLDADITRALNGVKPIAVESPQVKPKGKRRRYPVGTVAPLPLDRRRVFGVVHCRQNLDLMTHSTAAELRLALERVWSSARLHGLLKPVAIYLIGSGLSRVSELTREQLLIMIIDTFLKSSADGRCAPELRIMLRASELERIRISDVARFAEALDQNGR